MTRKFFETKFLVTLIFAMTFGVIQSQVVINEFCAANYSDWPLGGGWNVDYEDWIEFYNPTGSAIDLGGYHLSDNPANPTKWELPAGLTVPANGFRVVILTGLWDADPQWNGYYNSNFKITQTNGEAVVFADAGGTILESYVFGSDVVANQANHSWARDTDGGATWSIHTNPSEEASNGGATGTAYAATPQLSVQAGYYAGGTNVTITSPEAGVSIYYTTDGSEPNNTDMLYGGAISIDQTTVLRAIAYNPDADILPSFIETNTYFVGDDQHTIPVFSVSGTTLDGGWNGDELMHLEMFDIGGDFLTEATGDSNEHGNDSNAYDQRGFDYVTRDAMGYDHEVYHPIFHRRDRESYERLIFKAAANDNYSFQGGGAHIRDAYCHDLSIIADLKLDERATEFCIVYINGEYWGVYDVREKVDDIDFTDHYFGQPQNFVDFLKTWGGTWEEYGTGDDWYDLVDFVTTNDMTDAANYDYVQSQLNTTSLIDYFVLNSYVVCMDWLNWNTAWWRGRHPDGNAKKWRYVLWDLDATFGHYVNYTGVPDTGPTADPCDPSGMGDVGGQGHIPVLNALLDNETFWAEYINRYASLSNSYFSCDFMLNMVDSMTGVIAPEMQRQIDRWGGTYNGWENNVQQMKDFIEDRCSDEIVGGMEDCYDIEAVTLTIIVDGLGEVEISGVATIGPASSPWDGIYYAEVPIDLEALAGMGIFLSWEVIDGDVVILDPTDPFLTLVLTGDATIVAHFVTDLDPELVMFDVQPAGAGEIKVDAVPMGPYPNTVLTDGGLHVIEATENPWFVFNHWETINATINPDMEDPDGTFFVTATDTIIAFYDEIAHFEITVDVEPAGAGFITMDGVPMDSYPWTGVVEGEVDINFITIPVDEWSIFSHWEVNNHVVTPDEFSTNMIINLTDTDEIVAVYDVIPHYGITVIVEPAYSGSVVIDENLVIVQNDWTGHLGYTKSVLELRRLESV
jgi:hypothetical protein